MAEHDKDELQAARELGNQIDALLEGEATDAKLGKTASLLRSHLQESAPQRSHQPAIRQAVQQQGWRERLRQWWGSPWAWMGTAAAIAALLLYVTLTKSQSESSTRPQVATPAPAALDVPSADVLVGPIARNASDQASQRLAVLYEDRMQRFRQGALQ